MQSLTEVTYINVQRSSRTGYFEGFKHLQTGELLITDADTGRQVYVKPVDVTFPND